MKYATREALLRALEILDRAGWGRDPEPEDTTDYTPSNQPSEADRSWWAERTREEETKESHQ